MFTFRLVEDQIIWLALIVSLLVHVMVLFNCKETLIPHAQFSVQSSLQSVEVSVELEYTKQASREELLGTKSKGDFLVNNSNSVSKASTLKPQMANQSVARTGASPNYFQNQPPEYPELAKQMKEEGLVLLSVDVDQEGMPVKIEIIQSSGHRMLDESVLKAVRHWRFKPGQIGGMPVESKVTIPIRFRLEGGVVG